MTADRTASSGRRPTTVEHVAQGSERSELRYCFVAGNVNAISASES
jgi:hypothetical protein